MSFLDKVRQLLSKVASYFTTGKARKDILAVEDYVTEAMPFVIQAAQFVTAVTPTQVDDVVLAGLKISFPALFNPQATKEERRLQALVYASEALKAKYPQIGTSIAIAATQLAYFEFKNQEQGGAGA